MARMYNCGICGGKHPVGEPCPHKYKFKKVSDVSQKANKFYRTKSWKMKRKEILERDKYCQRCWIKFGIISTERLEVHHIEPLTSFWEKRLNNDNLICLCSSCHKLIDNKYNGNLDFEFTPKEIVYEFEFK